MTALTTAYAGHGDTTPENLAAVLDTFLPDNLGMVYIPARVPRFQAGLKKVITWLEGEVGQAGTIPVPDLIEALLQRNKALEAEGKEADDLTLVMLFDPEKEEDVAMARTAYEAGIRVVDLCSAGDDVLLDEAVISFAEEIPAEEEAAEVPPFEGGHPIGERPATPAEAAADEAVEELGLPGRQVQSAAAAGLAAAQQHVEPGGIEFTIRLKVAPEHVATLARAIVAAMGVQAVQTMAAEEVKTAAPAQDRALSNVTPIRGTADESAEGKPYYFNSDTGTYRAARGMARKTETKVILSPAEVEQIKADKLLA